MLPLLCYDIVFKSVFTNQENLLAKMISDITGIDYELLKDNIILETNELPISKNNEKAKRCDFIIRMKNNNIINLELNRQSYTGLVVKNLAYLFQLFSTSFKRGEEYDENLVVMQINLNCFKTPNFEKIKALSKYYFQDNITNEIYTENIIIYELNVVKCHEIYYNEDVLEIPNYLKWGTLIYCNNPEDIPNITKGIMTKEERDLIMDKLNNLTREDLFMSESDAIKWYEWEQNTIRSDCRKEGIEENKIETIKAMLENKIDLDLISKVTGKSIEEIKKYIED